MPEKGEYRNDDKRAIEMEEREKMLNEENRKDLKDIVDIDGIVDDIKDKIEDVQNDTIEIIRTGEVEKMKKQIEESQKEIGNGRRIPIGGIKIPGFLRSKSKDKNKENDGTPEEGVDLLEPAFVAENVRKEDARELQPRKDSLSMKWQKIKIKNPFTGKPNGQENGQEKIDVNEDEIEKRKDGQKRQSLIDSIKIPLVSVLPRTLSKGSEEKEFGFQEKDIEIGTAGLASVETLGDSKASVDLTEDGLETVTLDVEENKDTDKVELATKVCSEHTTEGSLMVMWSGFRERYRNLTMVERTIAFSILFLIILFIIIMIATCGARIATSPPVINGRYVTTVTSCGPVQGVYEEEIFKFRGIPYAVPPLGAKRWKPAEHMNRIDKCWNGTLKVYNSTATCWQLYMNGRIDGSENCLTVDIYSPFVRYDSPLPVVVLIGTTTLVGGAPGILVPSPKIVKSKEVVFVRPNFRLGIFGFLAVEALSKSVHPPSSGNYGLSDIIAVLTWVKYNIVHFGGNSKMITLVGHRAGATLVTALASSNAAKGLFQRAWASSGSAIYPGTVLQLTEQANYRYVENLCRESTDVLQCLRNEDAEELIESLEDSWRPAVADLPQTKEVNATKHEWLVLDGNILKENLWGGEPPHVTLVIGTTAHSEASPELWEKLRKLPGTREEAIASHIKSSYLGKLGIANEALELYGNTWEGLAAIVSDIRTVCPLLTFSRAEQNISFYITTLERNHTDFGQIADVDMDMESIMGRYLPLAVAQKKFVEAIQKLFFDYVTTGVLPVTKSQGVLTIGETIEWKNDYPNCNFWISKDIVPRFARRD